MLDLATPETDVPNPLVALGVELQRQLETKRDLMADTRRTSLAPGNAAWFRGAGESTEVPEGLAMLIDLPDAGAEAFDVTRHAHGQISNHLNVPFKLYERLLDKHPELFQHLVNGLLSREPSKRMLRTQDGKLRAFLSDKFRPRDNWDLLDKAVLPVLNDHPGRFTVKQCSLTETRMYVKLLLPDFERPITPAVGDVVRAGIIIQNSEVGAGSLVVAPYTDRLSCTNGMVHTDMGKRQRHVGSRITDDAEAWELYSTDTLRLDDEAFFAKCKDVVRAVVDETVFEGIVSQMRDLAGMQIGGDPVAAVEILADRHGFSEAERGGILHALIENSDLSGWGYVNAITQTARDLESADRQTELETIAGRMVSDPKLLAAAA